MILASQKNTLFDKRKCPACAKTEKNALPKQSLSNPHLVRETKSHLMLLFQPLLRLHKCDTSFLSDNNNAMLID